MSCLILRVIHASFYSDDLFVVMFYCDKEIWTYFYFVNNSFNFTIYFETEPCYIALIGMIFGI